MTVPRNNRTTHRGVAALWALVVVVVVSALSLTVAAQFAAARRQVDQVYHRVQAEWLARAGYELAVARLLADPSSYVGETATPVPESEVKITVTADPNQKGVLRVVCEARYPTAGHGAVSRLERMVHSRHAGDRPRNP